MKRKQLIMGILILAAGIGITVRIASLFSEEARVQRAVEQGVKAFERKDLAGCLEVVSDHYEDGQGLDKARIREGLATLFRQFSELKAEATGLKVNIEKDKATVRCELRVRGRGEESLVFLVGNLTSKEEAVLFLVKEQGAWRVVRVEGLGAGS